MSREFSSEEWRAILRLAREASTLAKSERVLFLQSQNVDEDTIAEALDLADQFDLEPDEPLGRAQSTIGRFKLLDYLGSGGSGEVYTAHDPELGRQVAIKIFRSDVSVSQSAQQRFIREARAASALNHPNIVTIYEIVRSDTRIAIVMEAIPGSPLRTLCGTEIEPQTVLIIGQQIADALAAAHSAGIVHRDVKPENIMLLPDGRVKVLDFGLARQANAASNNTVQTVQGGIPGGTLRYMSPEHFRTQTITAKSDVFALGLLLSELAWGRHPFSGDAADTPFDVFHAIATAELPRNFLANHKFPPVFEATVRAMLAKDPEMRPAAAEVAAALRGCIGELSPNYGDRTVRKSAQRRWAAASILILALATAGTFRWWQIRDPSKFHTLSRVTQLVPENRAIAAAISPDGKLVSYANTDGVFLQSLKDGEVSILNSPADLIVDTIAWLGDGTKLIVSGFSDEKSQAQIWSIPTNGAGSRELRTEAHFGAPSPDGSQIAFVNADYSSIGTMDLDGQSANKVLQLPLEDTIRSLVWSLNGHWLVIQRRHLKSGIERLQESDQRGVMWSLDVFDLKQRRITGSRANRPDQQLLALAALPQNAIAYMQTGGSKSKGQDVLSSIQLDPSTGRWNSLAAQPLSGRTLFGDWTSHSLSVSADGKKIALLRQTLNESIFVADFNRAALHFSNFRRLTLTTSPSFPHAWTPDSQQVIFESDRMGTFDLYKQRIDRRLPESLLSTANRSEYLPQLTPDGKYVLFASTPNGSRPFTLMRMPAKGGLIEEVPVDGPLDEFRCSVRPEGQCVLRKTLGQSEFVYYKLNPIQGIGKELARTAWLPPLLGDWDVSPDGNFVATPIHDRRSGKLRIIPLNSEKRRAPQHDVVLAGLTQIACVAWTTDGAGWFVNVDTAVGGRMYFSDLQGRLTPLGDVRSCAVPSPDGRKVAFHHNVIDSNVWLMTTAESAEH